MCLFAPAPYYKLDKGFFLGFLFKPLGGLCPPRCLNKKASEKYPLSITYPHSNALLQLFTVKICVLSKIVVLQVPKICMSSKGNKTSNGVNLFRTVYPNCCKFLMLSNQMLSQTHKNALLVFFLVQNSLLIRNCNYKFLHRKL